MLRVLAGSVAAAGAGTTANTESVSGPAGAAFEGPLSRLYPDTASLEELRGEYRFLWELDVSTIDSDSETAIKYLAEWKNKWATVFEAGVAERAAGSEDAARLKGLLVDRSRARVRRCAS